MDDLLSRLSFDAFIIDLGLFTFIISFGLFGCCVRRNTVYIHALSTKKRRRSPKMIVADSGESHSSTSSTSSSKSPSPSSPVTPSNSPICIKPSEKMTPNIWYRPRQRQTPPKHHETPPHCIVDKKWNDDQQDPPTLDGRFNDMPHGQPQKSNNRKSEKALFRVSELRSIRNRNRKNERRRKLDDCRKSPSSRMIGSRKQGAVQDSDEIMSPPTNPKPAANNCCLRRTPKPKPPIVQQQTSKPLSFGGNQNNDPQHSNRVGGGRSPFAHQKSQFDQERPMPNSRRWFPTLQLFLNGVQHQESSQKGPPKQSSNTGHQGCNKWNIIDDTQSAGGELLLSSYPQTPNNRDNFDDSDNNPITSQPPNLQLARAEDGDHYYGESHDDSVEDGDESGVEKWDVMACTITTPKHSEKSSIPKKPSSHYLLDKIIRPSKSIRRFWGPKNEPPAARDPAVQYSQPFYTTEYDESGYVCPQQTAGGHQDTGDAPVELTDLITPDENSPYAQASPYAQDNSPYAQESSPYAQDSLYAQAHCPSAHWDKTTEPGRMMPSGDLSENRMLEDSGEISHFFLDKSPAALKPPPSSECIGKPPTGRELVPSSYYQQLDDGESEEDEEWAVVACTIRTSKRPPNDKSIISKKLAPVSCSTPAVEPRRPENDKSIISKKPAPISCSTPAVEPRPEPVKSAEMTPTRGSTTTLQPPETLATDKPSLSLNLPNNRIDFNAPFDQLKTHRFLLTNEGSRRAMAWALKTRSPQRLSATPPNGVLAAQESVLITVKCHPFDIDRKCENSAGEKKDRISILWGGVPLDHQLENFHRDWTSDGTLTDRKNLEITYYP